MPSPESGSTRPAASPTSSARPRTGRLAGPAHRQAVTRGPIRAARRGSPSPRHEAREVLAQPRPLRCPAADADVDVVALREDPAVAAGQPSRARPRLFRASGPPARLQRDVALERDAVHVRVAEAESPHRQAVDAVGADHCGAPRRLFRRTGPSPPLPSSSSAVDPRAVTEARRRRPRPRSARRASRRRRWVIRTSGPVPAPLEAAP